MFPLDAAGDSTLSCVVKSAAKQTTDLALFVPMPGQWQPGDAVVCGQSRTTITTRHFAALIGRLWVGGY